MDRLVNRIKINRLYSEPEIFEPICFEDGVNIILGEKSDTNTTKGRKTNGVGKSMSIEFLNFCLLKKYNESRLRLIPKEILNDQIEIKLDLQIGNNVITIIRSRGSENKPIIVKESKVIEFNNLEDAQKYLSGLLYTDNKDDLLPSFREMISLLIREEGSEFKNILNPFDTSSKNIPVNFKPHLFLFYILLKVYKKTQDTVKAIKEVKKVISHAKSELTNGNTKKIGEIKAELNSLNDELKKMNDAIESFKSNESFEAIEKDLIEIEDIMDKLRVRQKALKYELLKIKSLPKPEVIDKNEIELVYNQFKETLGKIIVKSLEQTLEFKEKIESFQRTIINQRALELNDELYKITDEIRKLDDVYSEKLNVIDQKGVLKNLKASLKIYNSKNNEYSKTVSLNNEYLKADKEKKNLLKNKAIEIIELDDEIEKNKFVIDSFQNTLLSIHEYIMGNKECSFDIFTKNNNQSTQTIDIDMRIFDDGSHSVDRTKVFIYDMALLFNEYTRLRHPRVLVHDNVFDVDQDTLVQSLNFLAKQEEKYQDFQYILTLNRDKIEHEESLKQININIKTHRVAIFTKANKFLNNDYQEL